MTEANPSGGEEESILEQEPILDADAEGGGDEEEEDVLDRGKSAMEEEPMIKPEVIPTNIMPKLDADDDHDPDADREEGIDIPTISRDSR